MRQSSFPIDTTPISELHPALHDALHQRLRDAHRPARPYFIHMLGIPGSGKSTFARELKRLIPINAPVYVAFDELMEAIPAYHNNPDRTHAFQQHELEARAAGYTLLRALIDLGAPILLDHGGASIHHPAILEHAKLSRNYHITIIHITAAPTDAAARIESRETSERRHTPRTYLSERATIIDNLLPTYRQTADQFVHISNHASITTSFVTENCRSILNNIPTHGL